LKDAFGNPILVALVGGKDPQLAALPNQAARVIVDAVVHELAKGKRTLERVQNLAARHPSRNGVACKFVGGPNRPCEEAVIARAERKHSESGQNLIHQSLGWRR